LGVGAGLAGCVGVEYHGWANFGGMVVVDPARGRTLKGLPVTRRPHHNSEKTMPVADAVPGCVGPGTGPGEIGIATRTVHG
jgi:hypothetical protein